jgi:hypothetical protein
LLPMLTYARVTFGNANQATKMRYNFAGLN